MSMEKIIITPSFGSVLHRARMDVGLTREQVARVAGVDPSYLARCEKGLVEPTFSRAIAMLWVAGVRLRIDQGRGGYLDNVPFDYSRSLGFDPSTYSENPDV